MKTVTVTVRNRRHLFNQSQRASLCSTNQNAWIWHGHRNYIPPIRKRRAIAYLCCYCRSWMLCDELSRLWQVAVLNPKLKPKEQEQVVQELFKWNNEGVIINIHLFQKSLSGPKATSNKLTTANDFGTFSLFIYSSVDILTTCIFKWPNSSKWLLFNARRDNFSSTTDK